MIWTESDGHYLPWAYEKEIELESAIDQVAHQLFGKGRVYLEVKKLIGAMGKTRNISAITHIAPVARIEPWKDTSKYALIFSESAHKVGPLKLVQGGKVNAPQASRYTSNERIMKAKSLDDVFG